MKTVPYTQQGLYVFQGKDCIAAACSGHHAEHIAHCVTHYDDLVEALKGMLETPHLNIAEQTETFGRARSLLVKLTQSSPPQKPE